MVTAPFFLYLQPRPLFFSTAVFLLDIIILPGGLFPLILLLILG